MLDGTNLKQFLHNFFNFSLLEIGVPVGSLTDWRGAFFKCDLMFMSLE